MARVSKKILMVCKECKFQFMELPSQKNPDLTFCSKPCWYSWKSKNISAWNNCHKKTPSYLKR